MFFHHFLQVPCRPCHVAIDLYVLFAQLGIGSKLGNIFLNGGARKNKPELLDYLFSVKLDTVCKYFSHAIFAYMITKMNKITRVERNLFSKNSPPQKY